MPLAADLKQFPTTPEGYDMKCLLHRGETSKRCIAHCHSLKADFVVKIVNLDQGDGSLFESLQQEVVVMRMCASPQIIQLHTSFTHKTDLWLVLDYMNRGSCGDQLDCMNKGVKPGDRKVGFSEESVAWILHQALHGVGYLHKEGLIHRDIKADHLLIDRLYNVRLSEFQTSADGARGQARMTFVGTPCWMAPEVAEQESGYDAKADIWSLGITAMELANGKTPFSGMKPLKVLKSLLRSEPPALTDPADGGKPFSDAFKEFVACCLRRKPSDRQSSGELLGHQWMSEGRLKRPPADHMLQEIVHDEKDTSDEGDAVEQETWEFNDLDRLDEMSESELNRSSSELARGVSGGHNVTWSPHQSRGHSRGSSGGGRPGRSMVALFEGYKKGWSGSPSGSPKMIGGRMKSMTMDDPRQPADRFGKSATIDGMAVPREEDENQAAPSSSTHPDVLQLTTRAGLPSNGATDEHHQHASQKQEHPAPAAAATAAKPLALKTQEAAGSTAAVRGTADASSPGEARGDSLGVSAAPSMAHAQAAAAAPAAAPAAPAPHLGGASAAAAAGAASPAAAAPAVSATLPPPPNPIPPPPAPLNVSSPSVAKPLGSFSAVSSPTPSSLPSHLTSPSSSAAHPLSPVPQQAHQAPRSVSQAPRPASPQPASAQTPAGTRPVAATTPPKAQTPALPSATASSPGVAMRSQSQVVSPSIGVTQTGGVLSPMDATSRTISSPTWPSGAGGTSSTAPAAPSEGSVFDEIDKVLIASPLTPEPASTAAVHPSIASASSLDPSAPLVAAAGDAAGLSAVGGAPHAPAAHQAVQQPPPVAGGTAAGAQQTLPGNEGAAAGAQQPPPGNGAAAGGAQQPLPNQPASGQQQQSATQPGAGAGVAAVPPKAPATSPSLEIKEEREGQASAPSLVAGPPGGFPRRGSDTGRSIGPKEPIVAPPPGGIAGTPSIVRQGSRNFRINDPSANDKPGNAAAAAAVAVAAHVKDASPGSSQNPSPNHTSQVPAPPPSFPPNSEGSSEHLAHAQPNVPRVPGGAAAVKPPRPASPPKHTLTGQPPPPITAPPTNPGSGGGLGAGGLTGGMAGVGVGDAANGQQAAARHPDPAAKASANGRFTTLTTDRGAPSESLPPASSTAGVGGAGGAVSLEVAERMREQLQRMMEDMGSKMDALVRENDELERGNEKLRQLISDKEGLLQTKIADLERKCAQVKSGLKTSSTAARPPPP